MSQADKQLTKNAQQNQAWGRAVRSGVTSYGVVLSIDAKNLQALLDAIGAAGARILYGPHAAAPGMRLVIRETHGSLP